MAYTATPNFKNLTTALGLPARVPDLDSQLSLDVQAALSNPIVFVLKGQPTTFAAVNARTLTRAQGLVEAYPDVNSGQAVGPLVAKYGKILEDNLRAMPLDPSLRLDAGAYADHLGALDAVNGSIDMSQFKPFPLVVPAIKDPADAAQNPNTPPGPGFWHKLPIPMRGDTWCEGPGPGVPDGKTWLMENDGKTVHSWKGGIE